MWWPAGIVGLLMLGLIVWQLAIPRPYYTGTDSVDVSGLVADVNVGQTLCVPGLYLPGGTGQVQLVLFAYRPRVQAAVSVIAGGKTMVSRAAAAISGNLAFIQAPIPVRAGIAGLCAGDRLRAPARRASGRRRRGRPAVRLPAG